MKNILSDTVDGVRTIEIRRPEKKNALTEAMYRDLTRALADAESDPGVRVVLFRGHAGVFTSGNDIVDFLEHPPKSQEAPAFVLPRAVAATFGAVIVLVLRGGKKKAGRAGAPPAQS